MEQIKNSIFVTNILKMKRILSLLAFTLLLNSCDDGNLTQENISFDAVPVQKCTTNQLLYKLKDNESLIFEATGINFPTETSTQTLEISGSNRVFYRFYSDKVTSATICESIPPASPTVTDQWTASGGKIVINTTAVKTNDTKDNSSRITGYNQNITFKNITFNKTNGTQVYETFVFGDYIVSTNALPLAFTKVLKFGLLLATSTIVEFFGSLSLSSSEQATNVTEINNIDKKRNLNFFIAINFNL